MHASGFNILIIIMEGMFLHQINGSGSSRHINHMMLAMLYRNVLKRRRISRWRIYYILNMETKPNSV